jgi:hypothetical protein
MSLYNIVIFNDKTYISDDCSNIEYEYIQCLHKYKNTNLCNHIFMKFKKCEKNINKK